MSDYPGDSAPHGAVFVLDDCFIFAIHD